MAEQERPSFVVQMNDLLEQIVEVLIPVRTFMVVLSSAATVVLSLLMAFYFRFEFSFPAKEVGALHRVVILAIVIKLIVYFIFRLHGGMWRYVSINDLVKILGANLIASGVLIAVVLNFRTQFFPGFSWSVLVIDFFLCFLIMSGKRVTIRIIREAASKASGQQDIRTILVGNADNLNSLIHAMSATPGRRMLIGVCCDQEKTGRSIRGLSILGKPKSAAKCAKKHNASEILLLPPFSSPKNLRDTMDDLELREYKCNLRMVPTYADIADGNIAVSQIREVEIEDLLGRKPVKLDRTEVGEFVKGKQVMVTGAGGSIGSELCHQLAAYSPVKLVLFELSEYNLYEINRKLRRAYPELQIVNIVGDVRSKDDVCKALRENGIDVVYHAAAYKHVPLMEENPLMAFRTNVLGSANLAMACEEEAVKRFVMISTDKAVCPTSIMGATKRLAERIILERPVSGTEFVVVRFGNVLGSSGSVIPLFKQQIQDGGPVTVTSENVVRYFMSIPEAVDLVLQAGTIGRDRDIMVLEMGEQVRIIDMARKLIELSGFVPDKDIEIKVVGLRPGEKEYEELLTDEEKVDRTPYDRIYVARKPETDLPKVEPDRIRELVGKSDVEALRETIFSCIPEHKFNGG